MVLVIVDFENFKALDLVDHCQRRRSMHDQTQQIPDLMSEERQTHNQFSDAVIMRLHVRMQRRSEQIDNTGKQQGVLSAALI